VTGLEPAAVRDTVRNSTFYPNASLYPHEEVNRPCERNGSWGRGNISFCRWHL